MKKMLALLGCIILAASNMLAQENVATAIQPKPSSMLITKVDDNYILGDKTMTKEQYLQFIQANCTEAWNSYQKGNKLWKAGWGLLGSGIGVFVAGTAVYCVGAYDYIYTQHKTYTPYNSNMIVGGAITLTAGSLLMAGSIPCLVVGGIRRNNSHEVYNEVQTKNNMAVTFGLKPASNGLAMVVQF